MKKKPSIAMVLGMDREKPMDDEEEPSSEDMEYSDEQKEMASEFIDAVKANDPDSLLKAIHGLYMSYGMGHEANEEEQY